MYSILHSVFSDRGDGLLFKCFGIWHLAYIMVFVLLAFFVFCYSKNKSADKQFRTMKLFADIPFWIMVADFFFMPFAYEEIDIEKLPFHICTAMCVVSFLSFRTRFFSKYRLQFAVLGFISNLGYLIYPAGVMWHQTHLFSYRVIETLAFHGFMSVYGFLVMAYEAKENNFRNCHKDGAIIVCMTIWAMIGNYAYNGVYGGRTHFYNWFFVVRDPFYLLSESVAPYVMPILNVCMFFVAEMVIYTIIYALKRKKKNAVSENNGIDNKLL